MKKIISIFSITFLLSLQILAQVSLPSIVSDGMILQRNETVKVWGWATPGEEVTVKFLKKKYSTKTNTEGKWQIQLQPMEAGGPYDMEIKGSNKISIKNILIGDVWVCSGQSNMTHQFNRWQERYAIEINESNNTEIRQFHVPTKAVLSAPLEDIVDLKWVEATPETILDFTVIGYFFAKKLYDKYNVPQGIIMTCVGGTKIESWTSEEGFKEFPAILEKVKQNQDTSYVNRINREAKEDRATDGPKTQKDKGLADDVKWYSPSYEPLNWKRINIPGYWEDQGVRDLDGVVWFRREIEVPESMTGIEALVKLGRIVDADDLYINGQRVGGTGYQYPQREYKVQAGILKKGKNLFVIRLRNNYGKGGFVPDKPYLLLTANDTIDLKGYWKYKVGEVFQHKKWYKQGISAQNEPTALYNGMIAPFINFGVRGLLWYQGESNAGNPEAYSKLLPNIIKDWRTKWEDQELPFLIAQLPNYMEVDYLPAKSNWAEMREVQLETSLAIKNTGLGVNIDLGEWNDIHPGNKKPVGERLALEAMRISYLENGIITSPIYKSHRIEEGKVIIAFENVGSGLIAKNGEELAHFAIAGEDKKFEWGKAKIENNEVVVWNDEISNPKYIRYAWADNPDFANLYNKEGLPASPFEIEIK
ncbi:MAG: hypothetical protein PF541_10755 [Prolixibacteraceae bacterium]|jgi:sialate O-acetylesterase|nr:hypothetical protein [Prolixibacteraceae bacterium]